MLGRQKIMREKKKHLGKKMYSLKVAFSLKLTVAIQVGICNSACSRGVLRGALSPKN